MVELAYWLVPDARGQGYADDAVARVVEYAFNELGCLRVHAEAFGFNEGSMRLLGSASPRRADSARTFADGRRWDTLVFGVLAHEWWDVEP